MKVLYYIFLLLLADVAVAQTGRGEPQNRILFVFDASQSMYGRWDGGMKFTGARKLMIELVNTLRKEKDTQLALRVYGHQSRVPPQDCNDTKLEVPFSWNNYDAIIQTLEDISPRGTTPIAKSLVKAGGDFPENTTSRNIIILITDGIEECGGDPCQAAKILAQKGITIKPFVIGLGLGPEIKTSLGCIGNFYNADGVEDFKSILQVVITQALNPTSVQVNLLDIYGKPTETNVNMTFYNQISGNIIHNFIHTFNAKGLPDTLYLDNGITYQLKVHTIPPLVKKNIEMVPGKHNIIALDAPQGYLKLEIDGANEYGELPCIVRQNNKHITLNVQNFGETEKYLTGKYDVEILSLPRIYKEDVPINQSTVTTLTIKAPGIVTFAYGGYGYGSLYFLSENDQEFVCNLNQNTSNETIVLQPGTYRAAYRYKSATQTILTIKKEFSVASGESVYINF